MHRGPTTCISDSWQLAPNSGAQAKTLPLGSCIPTPNLHDGLGKAVNSPHPAALAAPHTRCQQQSPCVPGAYSEQPIPSPVLGSNRSTMPQAVHGSGRPTVTHGVEPGSMDAHLRLKHKWTHHQTHKCNVCTSGGPPCGIRGQSLHVAHGHRGPSSPACTAPPRVSRLPARHPTPS